MKCKKCGLVEMKVERNNGEEIEMRCPQCDSKVIVAIK